MDAFIAKHLDGVSRTYALLVPMLPPKLADAVGLAYLLMRIVDTLEDAPQLATGERPRLLDAVDAALDGQLVAAQVLCRPLGDLAAERDLMHAAPEVFARVAALESPYREAACACARGMGAGVRKLLLRSAERGQPYPALHDVPELREYCYYVAGVVGEMLCAMMSAYLRLPELLARRNVAVELGTGLQLVNILKDALKDARQGRRYLPLVTTGPVTATEVFRAVLEEARACLLRGVEYVLALPATARELRAFCGLPIAWGALTLARAEQEGSGAKISRQTVQATMATCDDVVGDDPALRAWLTGLLVPAPTAAQ